MEAMTRKMMMIEALGAQGDQALGQPDDQSSQDRSEKTATCRR